MKVTIPRGALYWATPGAASRFPQYGDFFFGIGVLICDPESTSQYASKGVLEQGLLGFVGEKGCTHSHLEGETTVFNSQYCVTTLDTKSMAEGDLCPRQLRKFQLSNGSWTPWSAGPISINSVGSGFKVVFPDAEDSTFWYTDQALEAIIHNDGTVIEMRETRASRYKSLPSKVIRQDNIAFYDVDIPNKRWRRQGGRYLWESFVKLKAPLPTSISLPETKDQFSKLAFSLQSSFEKEAEEGFAYGDLVRRAANDAQTLDTNMLELTRELVTIRSTIKSIALLAKSGVSVKNIAKAFLSYQYGPRLTVSDGLQIADDLVDEYLRTRSIVHRSRAKEVLYLKSLPGQPYNESCRCEYNYKITYFATSDDWRDMFSAWLDSGFFPTLQSTWDLIPFSFVADWFLKVDKYLDAIDSNTYWASHSVLGATYSKKLTYGGVQNRIISCPGVTFIGDISAVFYHRQVSRQLHTPLYHESAPRYFKNYAELSALIIARKR